MHRFVRCLLVAGHINPSIPRSSTRSIVRPQSAGAPLPAGIRSCCRSILAVPRPASFMTVFSAVRTFSSISVTSCAGSRCRHSYGPIGKDPAADPVETLPLHEQRRRLVAAAAAARHVTQRQHLVIVTPPFPRGFTPLPPVGIVVRASVRKQETAFFFYDLFCKIYF